MAEFMETGSAFHQAATYLWACARHLGENHALTQRFATAAAQRSQTLVNEAVNALSRHVEAEPDGADLLDRIKGEKPDARAFLYGFYRAGDRRMTNYPVSPGLKPLPAGACELVRQGLPERGLDGGDLEHALAAMADAPTAEREAELYRIGATLSPDDAYWLVGAINYSVRSVAEISRTLNGLHEVG